MQEYCLFRGFTQTLAAFGRESREDKACGMQAERIAALVFQTIMPSLDAQQLLDVLNVLDQRLYCRLDRSLESVVQKMEVRE